MRSSPDKTTFPAFGSGQLNTAAPETTSLFHVRHLQARPSASGDTQKSPDPLHRRAHCSRLERPRNRIQPAAFAAATAAAMPSSCKDIRSELANCLQYSDCVFKDRNKPADCLRPPLRDTLPPRCQQLQKSYADCKRGWVDMRKRFRGNRPISMSQELEADASGVSYQLYAGAPAFSSTEKGAAAAQEEAARKDAEEGFDPTQRR